MVNKIFIVEGIKNLLKRNYGIDPDTVDLEAHVDQDLTFGENWTILKEMLNCHSIDYEFLRCRFCNKQIRDDWIFCPKCGKSLDLGEQHE